MSTFRVSVVAARFCYREAMRSPLTVVVATTRPWPEIEACLEALHDQARAEGAEILVADGADGALPADAARRYPAVRCLPLPGASVFRLRARALEESRGDVVAVTEDHCRVAPDWCRRVLESHAASPGAAVIGGVVENGADRSLLDRASFLLVNGPVMPPVSPDGRGPIALQANVSYKRRVVPARLPAEGRLEWMFHRDLGRAGETLRCDDRIRVVHVQSLGVWGTCRIHFDDGRTLASFRRREMGPLARLAWLAATPAMPAALLVRALGPQLRTWARFGSFLAALPWLVALVGCRSAGFAAGLVAGPGGSPLRIR